MFHNFNFLILFESLLFVYASFLAGDMCLRAARMELSSRLRQSIYSLMVGYGFLAFTGFLLALFGFFYAFYLRFVFLLVFISSAETVASHLKFLIYIVRTRSLHQVLAFLKALFRENTLLKVIIALWLLANLIIVFVPITATDTLAYHLPIMFDIITKGKATFSPGFRYYDTIPVLVEILYAVPMVVFHNMTAPFVFQVLQYGVLALFLLLFHDFLRNRVTHKILLPAASILVLSLFNFQREIMHGGYIDVFIFLFGMASTLLILDNTEKTKINRSEFYLSAVMVGLALNMKYLGFFFLILNYAIFGIYSLVKKTPFIAILKDVTRYSLIVIPIAGYWYVRNFFWYGNPVYPMFSDPEFSHSIGWLIIDRTPLNFLIFPFYRFAARFNDPKNSSSELLVFIYFALVYALFLFFIKMKKRPPLITVLMFLFLEAYLGFSFLFSHQIRFMLPVLLMLPLLLVLLIDEVGSFIKYRAGQYAGICIRKLSLGALYAFALFVFFGNFHYFHVKFLYALGVYVEPYYIIKLGSQ